MSDRPKFIDKTTTDRPTIDLARGEYGRVAADAAAILEGLAYPAVAGNPAHAMLLRFLDSPWKGAFDNLVQCAETTVDWLVQKYDEEDNATLDEAERLARLKQIVTLALDYAEQTDEKFIGPEHLIVGLIRSLQTSHLGQPYERLAERVPDFVRQHMGHKI